MNKVKLNLVYNRVVCEEMKQWMEDHRDKVFSIENTDENACKLYGVGFWVTKDLLAPLA